MKNTIKSKKGFTLIELLAVIVILAIIALIAVPVIMNIINKSNKSAFKDTAYGVISAGELYFAEELLDVNGMLQDVTIELPDSRLELNGEVPEGSVTIAKDGKISIAVHNGRYCVTKGFDDTDVTVTEDYETCEEPTTNTGNTLASLATTGYMKPPTIATYTDPDELIEVPACATDGSVCETGTPVVIQVNEITTQNFYVIADDGTNVTLIMDSNLGDDVMWISGDDYTTAGGSETDYGNYGNNNKGPITAVATLKERTNGWTNIPEKEYTYSDDGGGNKYTAFTETMRARMLTYTEATTTLGCTTSRESCPSWLYINLLVTGDSSTYGYWTSAAYAGGTSGAHYIHSNGEVNNYGTSNSDSGLRPVIELSK